MQTYDSQEIYAGNIVSHVVGQVKSAKNGKAIMKDVLKYQGVIGIAFGTNIWLSEESDTPEGVDFNSRKNLLNENTIQIKKYELVKLKGGEKNG